MLRTFKTPLFRGDIVVAMGDDPTAEMIRHGHLTEDDREPDEDSMLAWVLEHPYPRGVFTRKGEEKRARWLVGFRTDVPGTGLTLNTIAHECFHLTFHIARYFNLHPITDDNRTEETYAYLHGELVALLTDMAICATGSAPIPNAHR
jgi:hypothetical protein